MGVIVVFVFINKGRGYLFFICGIFEFVVLGYLDLSFEFLKVEVIVYVIKK